MKIRWDKIRREMHAYKDVYLNCGPLLIYSSDPPYARLAAVLDLIGPHTMSTLIDDVQWYEMTDDEYKAVTTCDMREGS